MSVIVTLRLKADAGKLEAWAEANPDAMAGILEQAKHHGVMAHRFYANDGDEVMVIDEWPDAESFNAFFGSAREQIGPMMGAADVQGEPEVNFWHELDTHDQLGWGA
jgi:heme-degrading monooxygenase HmoA